MFDETNYLNGTKKYKDFKYWFRRQSDHLDAFNVIDQSTGNVVAVYNWFMGTFTDALTGSVLSDEAMRKEIQEAFECYKERPEYQVGRKITMTGMNAELAVTVYETLLVGIHFIRMQNAGIDPDESYKQISATLNWLRQTDMYTAPASTRYHDHYSGGLVIHHLNVYNNVLDVMKLDKFRDCVDVQSVALVALTHDWCKIGFYESYMRNVKDETTGGQWEKRQEWRYRDEPLGVSLGHGVSSMFLAGKCFRLTQEEAAAIRWHMGWCRVTKDEMNELQTCNERYPLVHLLQFADQLSLVKY